jgi:hypothetical protein
MTDAEHARRTPAAESREDDGVAIEDQAPGEERSFEEAIALYYGEWVLMKVLDFDEHFIPVRGRIIAHSRDRGALSEALKKEPPRQPDAPYQPYYPFAAFPRVRPGESLEQAAARFSAQRAAVEAARGG